MERKFAKKLFILRTQKGLSQNRLAKYIRVSPSSIFRWENSKVDINALELTKIAKFFGVSTDYLLGLED